MAALPKLKQTRIKRHVLRRRIINQTVTVTVDGISRKVPLTEAVTLSLAQRSLAGSVPAAREVMKIVERVEEKIAAEKKAKEEERPSEVQFVIKAAELKDCNTALHKLGVIQQYTDSWRICTWVVEAALARNSQIVLDENDRQHIAENMFDPAMLQPILSKAA
ncbi:MAG TPA: hypothetical protein VHX92_00330 [Rhizomicrobium sp.]|nr:hypothetical protein [Rhizomicrobium sp.]